MEAYDTLVEGINALKKQGYTEDFNLKEDCIENTSKTCTLYHNDFEIDKYFRFEGDSNPDDSSILYAISSTKDATKGILINAYGVYSDTLTSEMLKKLTT